MKILEHLPDNHIIKKRIEYCDNPIFNKNNFVPIKGGSFIMGALKPEELDAFAKLKNWIADDILIDNEAGSDENPHKVNLSDFSMNKYAITNAEYAEFLTIYGSDKVKRGVYKDNDLIDENWFGIEKNNGIWQPASSIYTNFPINKVSWFGANEFCEFWGLQLPTESQWEYAARSGGKNIKYSWGNDIPNTENNQKFGNIADEALKNAYSSQITTYTEGYNDGYSVTAPVDAFTANELELYQMSGNVYEWCADWYGSYPNDDEVANDPAGALTSSNRVLRGGSWRNPLFNCRVANRNHDAPGSRNSDIGFRPVLVP
ncbi:MAG TPA: hypothetical protein DCQ31_10685 [Bacteroidales bacterium]|nr:hypothetical protein [Bacteroidales bacterium]